MWPWTRKKHDRLTPATFMTAVEEKTRSEVKQLLSEANAAAVTKQALLESNTMVDDPTNKFRKAAEKRRENEKQRRAKRVAYVKRLQEIRKQLVRPKAKHLSIGFATVSTKMLSRKQKALRKEYRETLKKLKETKLEIASKQKIEEKRRQLSQPKHVLAPTFAGTISVEIRKGKDKEILEDIDTMTEQIEARKGQLLDQFKNANASKIDKGIGMAILLAFMLA